MLAKENESSMKLHRLFFLSSVYKAIYYTCVTQAYDRRSQRLVQIRCTKIGEKFPQTEWQRRGFCTAQERSTDLILSKIQFKVRYLVALMYMACSWRFYQIPKTHFSISSKNPEIICSSIITEWKRLAQFNSGHDKMSQYPFCSQLSSLGYFLTYAFII